MSSPEAGSSLAIGCCIRLGDALAHHYLRPIAEHSAVGELHILRHAPVPLDADVALTHYPVPGRFIYRKLAAMYKKSRALSRQKRVDAWVSFNPFPYGLVPMWACRGTGIPCHFGFIGSDWNRMSKSVGRGILKQAVMKADWITVPGEKMRREMIALGLPSEKITCLPHCVDLQRFPVSGTAAPDYDLIFVGRLVKVKRVDRILMAVAALKRNGRTLRLCVVGDGPLRNRLQTLASDLGIATHVDFVGHASSVADYLARARVFVMASESEGLPYALIEAMSCGLVPVCPAVGAIEDVVTDGRNGFLYAPDDTDALSRKLERLLADSQVYSSCRAAVLEGRLHNAYTHATQCWDAWLYTLARRKTLQG